MTKHERNQIILILGILMTIFLGFILWFWSIGNVKGIMILGCFILLEVLILGWVLLGKSDGNT